MAHHLRSMAALDGTFDVEAVLPVLIGHMRWLSQSTMARSSSRAQPADTLPQRVATRTLVLFALLARAESLAPADALSRRALGAGAAGALTTTAGVAAAKPAPPEVATDKRGKPLSTDDFLSGRPDGPTELVAGLGGEPTILLVEDGKLADLGRAYELFKRVTAPTSGLSVIRDIMAAHVVRRPRAARAAALARSFPARSFPLSSRAAPLARRVHTVHGAALVPAARARHATRHRRGEQSGSGPVRAGAARAA